jgi:ferritin-like metal-binding protein YciE
MNPTQLQELILQSLEQERGGVQVYETALRCAVSKELKRTWENYHRQTVRHVEILEEVCGALGIDSTTATPGTGILKKLGESLVKAMESALAAGNAEAAQIVACECVVLAETKDHMDWELLTRCGKQAEAGARKVLADAAAQVEDQEDEHLYHTRGWCRELWLKSLGLDAVIPPPEETRDARTAIEAARAEQSAHRH